MGFENIFDNELSIIKRLVARFLWKDYKFIRRSNREYDIDVEANVDFFGESISIKEYVPLSIIKMVNWRKQKIWKNVDAYDHLENAPIKSCEYNFKDITLLQSSSNTAIRKMMRIALLELTKTSQF